MLVFWHREGLGFADSIANAKNNNNNHINDGHSRFSNPDGEVFLALGHSLDGH